MDLALFDYGLPPERIAQAPAPSRDASRLLLIDRVRGTLEDRGFAELPELLRRGDCLVLNDSRVIPARIFAADTRGRPVELLFLEPTNDRCWAALVRPGRRCRAGFELRVGSARLRIAAVRTDGARLIERLDGTITELMDSEGLPPLPPYIGRHSKPEAEDWERYQTVYARTPGSVAAPTAGLHFTPGLLSRVRERGIEVHALTLHVGLATFRPIKAARVEEHTLPPERVVLSAAVADAVNRAHAEGRRVIGVGTTTARALEGAVRADGCVVPLIGAVGLAIVPGHRFRVLDGLLTNFHLPRSSLLVLVAAFAGRDLLLRAYAHAIQNLYRFYSYGDATLVL